MIVCVCVEVGSTLKRMANELSCEQLRSKQIKALTYLQCHLKCYLKLKQNDCFPSQFVDFWLSE